MAGLRQGRAERDHDAAGEGVAGRVIDEGVPINIGDIRSDPRYITLGRVPTIRSLLVAPGAVESSAGSARSAC